MKNLIFFVCCTICMSIGFTENASAAFPINNSNTVTIQKTQAITVPQHADPFSKFYHKHINPEHELGDIFSIVSLILGVLSIAVGIFSGVGIILGILGASLGLAAKHMDGIKKLAEWGFALSLIGIGISIIATLVS